MLIGWTLTFCWRGNGNLPSYDVKCEILTNYVKVVNVIVMVICITDVNILN